MLVAVVYHDEAGTIYRVVILILEPFFGKFKGLAGISKRGLSFAYLTIIIINEVASEPVPVRKF